MAKFTDKEWINNSHESGNPWSTTSTYINVGSLGKIMSLAERTGLLPKENRPSEGDQIQDKVKRLSPSVKLIDVLTDLANIQNSLNKVKVLIHHHHLEQETKDITNASILEKKTRQMEELSLHLSALVDKKDALISRLQEPFIGDYLTIDAEYHRYVAETVPALGRLLSNLTGYLELIAWSGKFSLEDGEMEKILGRVSSALAQMQTFYQNLCLSRNLTKKLLSDDNETSEK